MQFHPNRVKEQSIGLALQNKIQLKGLETINHRNSRRVCSTAGKQSFDHLLFVCVCVRVFHI